MKILPEYLIQYMPELEEALEELRLSVLDHAYELLKRLDIDELTTDEVRQKLELYDISVDNMSGDWLPNGRFYRLYPSIKHHRSRQNTIKAIAKSGGQFEGLWSDDFDKKSAYNFNKIQVARHYELVSNADGYFFVSGDTVKNAKGKVIDSAAQALTTDVLINQALPAGYTYLYIPWPRPVYPGDSSYFYNVNMLMYDRLHYAEDCDHYWKFVAFDNNPEREGYKIYVCVDNSIYNRYCSVPKYVNASDILYSGKITAIEEIDDRKECTLDTLESGEGIKEEFREPHKFKRDEEDGENDSINDAPFAKNPYDEDKPASTRYDWANGIGTPWRTPYWIDYHYMNTMRRSVPDGDHAGTWAIEERGAYYDEDHDPVSSDELGDAVEYVLADSCKELADSHSVFPTRCYVHGRYHTTQPDREQKFTPNNFVITISAFEPDEYEDLVIAAIKETFKLSDEKFNELFNNEVECTLSVDPLEDAEITLTDSDYEDYTGHLRVVYTIDGQADKVAIVEFANGHSVSFADTFYTESFIANNHTITNVKVYREVKFISTDEFLERFERRLDAIEVPTNVTVYNQHTNSEIVAKYKQRDDYADCIISLDNGRTYTSLAQFYSNGWIMEKYQVILYYGDDAHIVYYDDCTGVLSYRDKYDGCYYSSGYTHQDSIDSNDYTEPDRTFVPKEFPGPYRWDKLYDGFAFHLHESLHHVKTYKPFWNEKTIFSEYSNTNSGHSLFNWMNLKQNKNIPQLSTITGSNVSYYEDVIKDNEPPVSEITFTSFDRPTRGKLDPVYVGYLSNDINTQGSNHAFNNSTDLYIFDADEDTGGDHDASQISYDPEYYYTIIGMNYVDSTSHQQLYKINHFRDGLFDYEEIYAGFIGDPAAKTVKAVKYKQANEVHATCEVKITRIGEDDFSLTHGEFLIKNSDGIKFTPVETVASARNAFESGVTITFVGYDNDINQENGIEVGDISILDLDNDAPEFDIELHNVTVTSGAISQYTENNQASYNYITYKKSKIHRLWFSPDHLNTELNYSIVDESYSVAESGSLYNSIGSSTIFSFSENTVNIVFTIIEVYDQDNHALDFDRTKSTGITISVEKHDEHSGEYIIQYNNLRNSKGLPITNAAYLLCTVKVVPGSIKEHHETAIWMDYENDPNHHVLMGINWCAYTNIGNVEYEYIPYVSGGRYETEEFNVATLQIDGGQYETEDFDVESTVSGGQYETEEFNVEAVIVGGQYETNEFGVDIFAHGGHYETEEFIVEPAVSGGQYETNEFDVETLIAGGVYETETFIGETPIAGGQYETETFVGETSIVGGQYETNIFIGSTPVLGGQYESEDFSVEENTVSDGGIYTTSSFELL